MSLLVLTTLNIANADSNQDRPIPFQHSQSQLQPLEQQPQHPYIWTQLQRNSLWI